MTRSARRETVRARCSAAAAGLPPGSTKERNGASAALSRSISPSSRSTWAATMRSGSIRRRAPVVGRRQVGAEVEQVVLDARQHGVELRQGAGVQAGEADAGVGLVDRAVGLDARVALRPPGAAGARPVVPSSPVRV